LDEDDEELPALLSESDDDEDGVLERNEVKIKSKL
jgi:Ca2+-binding EF-hand superfamily protein